MSVLMKDYLHGAVLSKLMRSGKKVALTLIEIDREQSQSAYLINDAFYIYVKNSKTGIVSKRSPDAQTWTFTFTKSQLEELQRLNADKQACLALVCAQGILGNGNTQENAETTNEICFMQWNEVESCIDFSRAEAQSLKVTHKKHHNLRVYGPRNTRDNPIQIKQDSLERWDVPGR